MRCLCSPYSSSEQSQLSTSRRFRRDQVRLLARNPATGLSVRVLRCCLPPPRAQAFLRSAKLLDAKLDRVGWQMPTTNTVDLELVASPPAMNSTNNCIQLLFACLEIQLGSQHPDIRSTEVPAPKKSRDDRHSLPSPKHVSNARKPLPHPGSVSRSIWSIWHSLHSHPHNAYLGAA